MVSPVVVQTKEGPKIMWNVESNVGLFSPNKTTDVELVQLAYRLRLKNPEAKKTAEERAAVAKITPGAICTGKADDPLVQAIVAHQKSRGGTQDSHVSKFTSSGNYVDKTGPHTHMLVALNFNMMNQLVGEFPRIDKDAECPPALKAEVVRICAA